MKRLKQVTWSLCALGAVCSASAAPYSCAGLSMMAAMKLSKKAPCNNTNPRGEFLFFANCDKTFQPVVYASNGQPFCDMGAVGNGAPPSAVPYCPGGMLDIDSNNNYASMGSGQGEPVLPDSIVQQAEYGMQSITLTSGSSKTCTNLEKSLAAVNNDTTIAARVAAGLAGVVATGGESVMDKAIEKGALDAGETAADDAAATGTDGEGDDPKFTTQYPKGGRHVTFDDAKNTIKEIPKETDKAADVIGKDSNGRPVWNHPDWKKATGE